MAYVSNNPGYTQADIQYYTSMQDLCVNNYYWCVKEDLSTGIYKFYLCNTNGLMGTFQLSFSDTDLATIYTEKEDASASAVENLGTGMSNCYQLYTGQTAAAVEAPEMRLSSGGSPAGGAYDTYVKPSLALWIFALILCITLAIWIMYAASSYLDKQCVMPAG